MAANNTEIPVVVSKQFYFVHQLVCPGATLYKYGHIYTYLNLHFCVIQIDYCCILIFLISCNILYVFNCFMFNEKVVTDEPVRAIIEYVVYHQLLLVISISEFENVV